jgi:catechol-2,3-dioxygenase
VKRLNRREFCRGTLVGLPGLSLALGGPVRKPAREEERMARGILKLCLQTHRLPEVRAFYRDTLRFPIQEESVDSVTFQAGATSLTFVRTPRKQSRPFYHFAFNIPENKLPSAREWLEERTPLATRGERVVFHFPDWNAHAIYFWDPGGNLGELIARHDLPNARGGAFTAGDILYASEIGLVVKDVPAAVRALQARLALPTYRDGSSVFEPLGDEHRLLIVVQEGRPWMGRESAIFPTTATLQGAEEGRFSLSDHPYTVEIEPG